MKRDMDPDGLLELQARFGDYVPGLRLSDGSCEYRDVYQAENVYDEVYHTLTVYDYDMAPDCLKTGDGSFIREAAVAAGLHSPLFPKYVGAGMEEFKGRKMVWFATEYIGAWTLERHFGYDRKFTDIQIPRLFKTLVDGLSELSAFLDGTGGHYNISPYNLMVEGVYPDDARLYLTGLNYASPGANGRPLFDASLLNVNWRAPETFVGRYDSCSDVFAAGLALACMYRGGELPWAEIRYDGPAAARDISAVKLVRRQPLDLDGVPEGVRDVILKALSVSPSGRYRSVDEMWKDYSSRISYVERQTDYADESQELDLSDESDSVSDEEEETDKGRFRGFKAVAGMDDLKKLLSRNFISILKYRKLAERFRISPPNGMLLYGPPGCGKTFIAERAAEEAGIDFQMVKPSDIGSIYVHGSQGMIADVFSKAESRSPVILCFDEFDAMVPARSMTENSPNQANEVNEFLVQLNNCAERGIYVLAMTNRPDMIDRAVLRKGRIDELIYVPLPDREARKGVFSIGLDGRICSGDIDCDRLAEMTDGYTCADISYIIQETARSSFEDSIMRPDNEPAGITQMALEDMVRKTVPSVSADDLRRYERLRRELTGSRQKACNRIGFLTAGAER